MGDREIWQSAAAHLRGRRRRGDQLHRRRHLAPFAERPQARRQTSGLAATDGDDPTEDLRYVWSFELNIIGSNSFYDDDLTGLMTLIADGKIKPVIDKVLSLEEAKEGLRLIQDREVIGKVVVTP